MTVDARPAAARWAPARRSRSVLALWLCGLLLLLQLACDSAPGGPAVPRRTRSPAVEAHDRIPVDVVLVLIDTLRADHLSLYGYDRETTPFLETLAAESVLFLNARAQAGCTFPSVNSLLTSRHAAVFLDSMQETGWAIPGSIPTLAELLRDAGYSTLGFSASPIVRQHPGPQNPDGGFGAGFDLFDDDCERRPASCIDDRALAALHRTTGPVFLFLHYFDPHDPYQPPADHVRRFATRSAGKDWVDDGSMIPAFKMLYRGGPAVEFDADDLARTLDLYDEEILYLDAELERLIAALRARGRFDDTLLVLAADHGEEFLEHGDLFHCKSLGFDTVIKTPLLIRFPGARQVGRRSSLVENLDILPTLLDYLGVDPGATIFDGKSLRPVVEVDRAVHRYQFAAQTYARVVTDGRWKLIHDISTGATALFDLDRDPLEQIDISSRRPRRAADLLEALSNWVQNTEAANGEREARMAQARETIERLRTLGYL